MREIRQIDGKVPLLLHLKIAHIFAVFAAIGKYFKNTIYLLPLQFKILAYS